MNPTPQADEAARTAEAVRTAWRELTAARTADAFSPTADTANAVAAAEAAYTRAAADAEAAYEAAVEATEVLPRRRLVIDTTRALLVDAKILGDDPTGYREAYRMALHARTHEDIAAALGVAGLDPNFGQYE